MLYGYERIRAEQCGEVAYRKCDLGEYDSYSDDEYDNEYAAAWCYGWRQEERREKERLEEEAYEEACARQMYDEEMQRRMTAELQRQDEQSAEEGWPGYV